MIMNARKDIFGGLAMVLVGAYAARHAFTSYEIGTLFRLGPGYLPGALGVLLAGIGLLIAALGLRAAPAEIAVAWRPFLLITLSLVIFGFGLERAGLVASAFAAVLVASCAERNVPWRSRLAIAVGVTLVTWLVFSVGLRMGMPVLPWSR